MQDLLIYGIGGMARETVYLIEDINRVESKYHLVGFSVDEEYYQDGMEVAGCPVYTREWLFMHRDDVKCVCAVGYPKDRRKVMHSIENEGVSFATLIHPTATIVDESKIGIGSIIGAYCSTSVDNTLGKGVFLNGAMVGIGHDCVLDDFVTCFPKAQISGGCHIGEAALIGSMAYIHEKRTVGKEAVVAPGSVVMRNVKPKTHVMGNPAKVIDI